MRITRLPAVALLAFGLAAASVAPAAADSTPSPGASKDAAGPTRAGTSFRTATEFEQGQTATARASVGDYLYWSFPADAGQRPTVRATVKLPETHAAETWRVDVYDGLRRRQTCQYGAQTRTAPADAPSVELACVLRTVRAWSEPWANDPLPGTYYVRLTAVNLSASDLGQSVDVEVRAESKDMGGAAAVDGSLAEPLVPGIALRTEADDEGDGAEGDEKKSPSAVLAALEPEDGWASGWWSDRWVWTAVGGALAALAGVAGYRLTRGSGRPSRVPPGA
ncbi:hypothetical protein ABZ892_14540 [Streptomyces sp. NPDC046924]|uniref:hypothetical protein n=1 Tax=Streptomyces sp. NPDC046924 TaxID=3155136 RepID=UPI0033CF08F0